MKLSEQGRRLLQGFEGLMLTAYPDPPNPNPAEQLWSIGYGHQLGKGPQWQGTKITRAEAERLFDQDVASREVAVSLQAPTNVPHRFDAMVSLAYNIGLAESRFPTSTVKRLHNAGDFQGAADAFRMWNKSGGAVNPVLVARREKERAVYLGGYGTTYVPPGPTSPTPAAPPPPPVAAKGRSPLVTAAVGLLFFCPSSCVGSSAGSVEVGKMVRREHMTIRQTLPPRFDGVVFAYPLVKFRPDRIQLPQLDGVVVMIDGRAEPCDGSMWAIEAPAVCVGGFVAVHVTNLSAEPRELVLRLIGQVVAEPGASSRVGRGDVAREQGLTWALGGGR